MMPLLYEGLYRVNARFEAEPVLCQSASPNPEKTIWIFTVKSGITCSDGTAVTGELCKASLLAAKASPLYGGRLRNVTAIAADGQSLTLSLSAPNENLPLLLDTPIFAASDSTAPAGTGPYVLKDGKLTKRPDWWQKKSVPQETIPLFECATADELVYAFDAGNVGLVTADLTGTAVLGYSGNYEVAEFPTTGMLYVGFNALSGPGQDAALRRALAQGLDRATICASLLAGHATPAVLPRHPDSEGYDEKLAAPLQYSEKNLADGLTALGFQKGEDGLFYRNYKPLALKLLVGSDNSFKTAVADFIAESFRRCGVTVTVQKATWEEYNAALKNGKFDLYLGETKLTADFDATPLFARGGSLNFGGFGSAELETLWSGLAAGGDSGAFYTRFVQDLPFAPICFKSGSVLTQWGRISDITPTASNAFYGIDHLDIH